MSNVAGFKIATERVRPSYFPVLRAHIELLEESKPTTYSNVAKKLGRSKQAVRQLCQRHPDLLTFIDAALQAENDKFVGAVIRQMAHLAMKGSPQHAEIYLKHIGGVYARSLPLGDGDVPGAGPFNVNNYTFNCLVPRPAVPQLAAATPPAAAVLSTRPSDIPTVRTR